ncbi:MAG: class I SAM-dependent methyltransferase [Chloroflexota bacterium]|nr:class I SAM-dependent methyltransferase [Chloroflexota bacterium]
MNEYTAANRDAWDAIAEKRHGIWPSADFFARGGSLLREHELEAAGDVRGLSLCHLQCGSGEETISWANAGATVTGVDISPKQIDLARRKAEAAGITAGFLAADVSSRPAELSPGSFDIVYTGGGALGWLPDLDSWAASVHDLLKPSGRLILNEEHPQLGNLEVRDGSIAIVGDYFDRRPHRTAGWRHFAGAEDAPEPRWEFSWTLGDIVTSVARAGLRIESLQEFPSTANWRFGDDLPTIRRLLGSFLLVARRVGS